MGRVGGFLISGGAQPGAGDPRVPTRPEAPALLVYPDHARLGGVETLRQIQAVTVTSIELLDPAPATCRQGHGHPQGAILVPTGGDAP